MSQRGFSLVEALAALAIFAILSMGVMALSGNSVDQAQRLRNKAESDAVWRPIIAKALVEMRQGDRPAKVPGEWRWASPWGDIVVTLTPLPEFQEDNLGLVRLTWTDPAKRRPPIETLRWFTRADGVLLP